MWLRSDVLIFFCLASGSAVCLTMLSSTRSDLAGGAGFGFSSLLLRTRIYPVSSLMTYDSLSSLCSMISASLFQWPVV